MSLWLPTRREIIAGATATAGAALVLPRFAAALPFPKGLFDGRGRADSRDTRFGSGSDADGRAVLPLHPAARRIWVDTRAPGSGDGRSPASPFQRIEEAAQHLRGGDQLMIAGGSVLTSEQWIDLTGRSGRSPAFPTVLQSYDRDAPLDEARHGLLENGVVHRGPAALFIVKRPVGTENIAIRGLNLDHTDNEAQRIKYSFAGGVNGLLLEQCLFDGAPVGLNTVGDGTSGHVIRQCGFARSWSGTAHAQGIYTSDNYDIVVEDCVFYHCGWRDGVARDTPGSAGGPTMFNHGLYASVKTAGVLRRSLFVSPASHGAQLRGNWVSHDNVFLACPLALIHGQGTKYAENAPEGVRAHAYRNIIANTADISPRLPRGLGIEVANTQEGSLVEQNLIVAPEGTPRLAGLAAAAFVGPGYDPNPTAITFARNTNLWSPAGYNRGSRGRLGWPDRVRIKEEGNLTSADEIAFVDATRSGRTAARALGFASIDAMAKKAVLDPAGGWARRIADHIRAGYVPKSGSAARLSANGGGIKGALLPDGRWNDG